MSIWAGDLRFAEQGRRIVDLQVLGAAGGLSAVHSIDDDQGVLTVYDPQTMSDHTNRRKFRLDDITSVPPLRWVAERPSLRSRGGPP